MTAIDEPLVVSEIAINVNWAVEVTLTPKGISAFQETHTLHFGARWPAAEALQTKEVRPGVHRFQLWELMMYFGPHLMPAALFGRDQLLFETDIVVIPW